MKVFALAGVVFLCATPLVLPNGGWLGLCALAAMGGMQLLRGGGIKILPTSVRWLGLVPLILAVAILLASGWHGEWRSGLPLLLVAMLSALAACSLPVFKLRAAFVFAAFALTGITSGVWAVWQKAVWDVWRAQGHEPLHPILFGNMSLAAGLVCLAGLAWARQLTNRRAWLLLLCLGALGGLSASLLSGTRGGWLALPLVGLIFYRVYLHHWPLLWRGGLLAIIVILLFGVYSFPQTSVQDRVHKAVEQGRDYWHGEANGSVGIRLELYRTGIQLIADKPWLGYSLDGYQSAMQTLYDDGEVQGVVAQNWHAHNDMLNAWIRYGVLGLLAILLLYLWPIWFFSRQLKVATPEQRPMLLAGLLLPVMFFDFGLSYALFAYPVVLASYWMWLILLVGMVLPHQDGFKQC